MDLFNGAPLGLIKLAVSSSVASKWQVEVDNELQCASVTVATSGTAPEMSTRTCSRSWTPWHSSPLSCELISCRHPRTSSRPFPRIRRHRLRARATLSGILSLSLSWRTLIRECARARPSSNVRAKSNEWQFSSARQFLPSDGENLVGREERPSELIQVRYLAVVSVQ